MSVDSFELDDGAKIAVIGGGPSGSFFSLFALNMAELIGQELEITIFEPKDFQKSGPAGCNRCGGIISELLVQTLAIEGIALPDQIIQKGINSYVLHTSYGSVAIQTPDEEKTIASVYRAGSPKGADDFGDRSFDNYLLSLACERGARHVKKRVDDIHHDNGRPVIVCGGDHMLRADLVVGAFGVNSSAWKMFEKQNFRYESPEVTTTAIAEIHLEREVLANHFGNAVHLFLLPDKDIKFAAMIPKDTHLTACVLGKNLKIDTIDAFLEHPVVKNALPDVELEVCCKCLPKMNINAPKYPFTDRMVACGDSGSSRLFKDGIGAAYLMGKAAAETAIFHGVGTHDFRTNYYPVYRSLVRDNRYGKMLFFATDLLKKSKFQTRSMLEAVHKEQGNSGKKVLSSILWGMFTGSERYKKLFLQSLNPRLLFGLFGSSARVLFGKGKNTQ